jgi:hypothetical protein
MFFFENTRTHHIHIAEYGGDKWNDYISFPYAVFRSWQSGLCHTGITNGFGGGGAWRAEAIKQLV